MSTDKQPRLRKAGERVFPAPRKSPLELLRPPSECSTTDLITELAHKVKVAARRVRRQPVPTNDDEPEAA